MFNVNYLTMSIDLAENIKISYTLFCVLTRKGEMIYLEVQENRHIGTL